MDKVKPGVRQGYVLFADLFSLYDEILAAKPRGISRN